MMMMMMMMMMMVIIIIIIRIYMVLLVRSRGSFYLKTAKLSPLLTILNLKALLDYKWYK